MDGYIMEASPTDKTAPRKWFTLNRVLLIGIMALQVAILVALYRSSNARKEDQGRRMRSQERASTEPTGYFAAIPASTFHRPLSIHNPSLDEMGWDIHHAPPLAHAQAMHEEMNRMLHRAYDQFSEMERLLDADTGWNSLMTSPTMDMREQGDSYVVDFSLPGIHLSEIEVTLEGRLLTLSTRVNEQAPTHQSLTQFERKVLLPGPVEAADAAHATVTNGVLKVVIPKAKGATAGAARGRIFSGSALPEGRTH